MIDLQNLIDFFPYYFKENDSYKVDGKGLLERFLNICGDYFQQYPLADIDSFLENLDVNKTNIIFVNNFWKFFGELPFAQGPIIDPEIFTKTFTGFNFDEAIEAATLSNEAYTGNSTVDYRSLIKYSVSLFKIRGTQQFFDIMFRLYGMNVAIEIPSGEDPFQRDHISKFDVEGIDYDKATFDNYYRCQNCSEVTFNITLPSKLVADLRKQSIILHYINQISSFINRFVPFYINPIIKVKGQSTYNQVTIKVDKTSVTLGLGESDVVKVTVAPAVPGNTLVPLTYRVAVTDGDTPNDSDWSLQEYSDPEYKIFAGGKTYWFKPVAPTMSTIPLSVKAIEQYTSSQYMIWVESPTSETDAILSKDKKEISIVVKARQYTFTYKDGQVDGAPKETKPIIRWDTAPEDAQELYPDGEARVSVDYYGKQIFSIANFPTRKTFIDIGVTDDYKKELDKIILSIQPKFILIKDNTFTPGTLNENGEPATPGLYQSENGSTWSPLLEYQTIFNVVNRDGQTQPDANIVEVGDITKIYHPGEAFIPPTKGASNFTFKATLGQLESETVTLNIQTSTPQVFNPIPSSIKVYQNPWYFTYVSGEVTAKNSGEVIVAGLTKTQAYNYVPKIKVSVKGGKELVTLNGVYMGYSSGLATYSFEYSHTIKSNASHTLVFTYTEKTRTVRVEVPVVVEEVAIDLYLETEDKLDQWTVNQGDEVSGKAAAKRGTELTFKAKAGKGNNIAKFTIKGVGIFLVTASNDKTYDVNSENPIEIEVNGNEDITFKGEYGGSSKTLTLHLVDYEGIVKISCSPTQATITVAGEEVKTTITGSTNKSDTFRFKINDTEAIYEIPNNGTYEYKTKSPGTHTFRAVDDSTKTAQFIVNSTVPTDIEVTHNSLNWAYDDTSVRSFQVIVPSNAQVTITEETL